ncbi:MAG: metal-dependent transcriptional regulator [Candidatus Gracilibacteria bacterium]|nr:metal-dependent transcriptional regulator [Candidatus Gracilibacteria bacterium]
MSKEDYLRLMYKICEEQGLEKLSDMGIKKVDIAQKMNISKPSVTQMMNKFAKEDLVKIDSYSKVFFTNKGLKLAKKITYNYRIIETFLQKTLEYDSLDKIREEAHKLEHAFSDEAIQRLDNFLGNPKVCPHGDKINKNIS